MSGQKRNRNDENNDDFVPSLKRHKSNQSINLVDYGMFKFYTF